MVIYHSLHQRTILCHLASTMNLLIFLLLFRIYAFAKVFTLSDLHWTLKNHNGSIMVPGTVPSQTHLDLVQAGIITEPLIETNDFTQRWIVDDNWTYTADLEPFFRTLSNAASKILLVFYGLDTISNIVSWLYTIGYVAYNIPWLLILKSLAGHAIAWTNNQFRQYIFDVTDYIICDQCNKEANLTITFESPYVYGQNVSSRSDAETVPGGNGDFEYPGVRYWIRKIASDFGWDWVSFTSHEYNERALAQGPAFVPNGVYKPAYLVTLSGFPLNSTTEMGSPPISPPVSSSSHDTIFIEETSLDIYKVGQNFSTPPNESVDWVINISFALRSGVSFESPVITLAISDLNITSNPFQLPGFTSNADHAIWLHAVWRISDSIPQHWFPHNLATGPKLYNITVNLALSNSIIVQFPIRTGFRTIQLIQSPYSEEDIKQRGITPGDQWHFKLNRNEFYAMGTNIIPFDPFYAGIASEKVRWILESAVLSGQNMLRVWGGGTYQPSSSLIAGGVYDFYSLCDELGILVWSEFIFSDALYPINDFLLETIEPGIRQNVRHINKHLSNVQWAGGNEIEGIAIWNNNSLSNGTIYLNEFVFVFQEFLHDITVSETRSIPYTDCSTTKGVLSLDPYVLRFNNGTPGYIYGNGERYNYDASFAFDFSLFPVSRFVNEFGYHSMPSFYTWEEVLMSPDDFSFNSTTVISRDHHPPPGDLQFPNPNTAQGQGQMTTAVERWLPRPNTPDTNQTFAQWCWSTWSSIEYSGRWKVLNYGLAQAFTPVNINPFWTASNETLEIMITSDRWEDVDGTAQLTWYDWSGNELVSETYPFTVPPLNNTLIYRATGLENILPQCVNASDVWLLLNSTASVGGGVVASEQYFTPLSLVHANHVDPKIDISFTDGFTFTLSAKSGVAPWTWIDHPSGTIGVFVDSNGKPSNGFFLVPGTDRIAPVVEMSSCAYPTNPHSTPSMSNQENSSGGGLMGKVNSAFGGGQQGEQNEDMLDKGVDMAQERMGGGPQNNESAVEQAKDEKISDGIRSGYKSVTGSDIPIADKS
ncbi:glycoside hydrolase family 2 protein [Crucibulum laeve]|uniref:Beta-mannosidase A n=1 Tax=Crucibulum laeve TaxID=68775 RepID=A0A5C3MIC6_9AGAR|nr:glycoside hydrolase family 2 protein [Crucibulum laeve]